MPDRTTTVNHPDGSRDVVTTDHNGTKVDHFDHTGERTGGA